MFGAVWEEGAGLSDCPQLPPEGSCSEGGRVPAIVTGSKQRGILRAIDNFGEELEQGCHWAEVVVRDICQHNFMRTFTKLDGFEFRMVRIIPWDVRMISLRNTELGPVILPMHSRLKKAVRVAAQNCRSGRICKRSWRYIICKMLWQDRGLGSGAMAFGALDTPEYCR